jgi:rhodanese-related sulfurtransferase
LKFLTLALLFIVGWEILWWLAGVRPISPWHLKKILESSKEDYLLIDARTPVEYDWSHIEGVRNYPNLLLDPGGLEWEDLSKPVVVICMSGHRAPVVGFRLKQRGFKEVQYLSWGMLSWWVTGGGTRF